MPIPCFAVSTGETTEGDSESSSWELTQPNAWMTVRVTSPVFRLGNLSLSPPTWLFSYPTDVVSVQPLFLSVMDPWVSLAFCYRNNFSFSHCGLCEAFCYKSFSKAVQNPGSLNPAMCLQTNYNVTMSASFVSRVSVDFIYQPTIVLRTYGLRKMLMCLI